MRNPHKNEVVKVSVLIKRAMLVVTKEDSKDLKRFCRDVFHKVKLGMSPGEITDVIMERDARAAVLGMCGVEPALRHAAELSLNRQKTLADLKREEEMLTLSTEVEAKIKEALDIAGIAADSEHGQGVRNHILQAVLSQPRQQTIILDMANIIRAKQPAKQITIQVSDSHAEEPAGSRVSEGRADAIDRIATRLTVAEALDAKAYYRSDTRVRAALQVLQKAYANLQHEKSVTEERLVSQRAEQEATGEALLKVTKRLETLVEAVDLHACASIGLAASTWLKLMDTMGVIKRALR